jgi:hypothetical protein
MLAGTAARLDFVIARSDSDVAIPMIVRTFPEFAASLSLLAMTATGLPTLR